MLVPSEDVDALQVAIATMIKDDALRQRMGAAGRQRMQKEFSIDTMVDRHITLYEAVLNG
jgi:glycosyltransferase involved in cell wall biosynthesis